MLPSLVDYYGGLTAPIYAAMGVGATLTVATIAIFFANLPSVLRNVPKAYKSKTVFLLSIHQVMRRRNGMLNRVVVERITIGN